MTRRELQYPIPTPAQIPAAQNWLGEFAKQGLPAGPVLVTLTRPRRGLDQNAALHAVIADIHTQGIVEGPSGERLVLAERSPEHTKAALVDAFADEMRSNGSPLKHPGGESWNWVARRFVSVRPSTTQFTKSECSEFIEWLYSTGADMGVQWSQRAETAYDTYREVAA